MKYTKEEKEQFIAQMKARFGSDVQELPTFGLPVKDIELLACAPTRSRSSYAVFTVGAPGTRSEGGVEVHQEFLIELPQSWMMPATSGSEDNILKSSPEQLLAHLFLPIAMRIKTEQGGSVKRWGVYDLDGYVKHAPAAHDYTSILFIGALSEDEDELDFDLGAARTEVMQIVPIYDEERELYFDAASTDFDELFYPECKVVSVRRRCFGRDPDWTLVDFEFAADSLGLGAHRKDAAECWAAAAAGFAAAALELGIVDESGLKLYSAAAEVFAGDGVDAEALRRWMNLAGGRLGTLFLLPIGAEYARTLFAPGGSSFASRFAAFAAEIRPDCDGIAAASEWIFRERAAVKEGFRAHIEAKIRCAAGSEPPKPLDSDAVVRTSPEAIKMGRLPDVLAAMPSNAETARCWLALDGRSDGGCIDVPATFFIDSVNELGADAASCLGRAPATIWACTRSRGYVALPFKIVKKRSGLRVAAAGE